MRQRFRARKTRLQLTLGIEHDISPRNVNALLRFAVQVVPDLYITLQDGCIGDARLAVEEQRCEDELFLPIWEDPFVFVTATDAYPGTTKSLYPSSAPRSRKKRFPSLRFNMSGAYSVNKAIAFLVIVTISVTFEVSAATITRLKSQNSALIQQDTEACRSQANAQHPIPTTIPVGGRMKGAATGAVAGAAAAEVRGRQHDQIYDQIGNGVKQDYRQNQAATDQAVTANNSVYTTCLQQRGYDVMP